ncbi:MAG TPA: hypothetical protein VKL21_05475 [Candidatus Methanoperedens sp.]|nr:hypothetical protein [Candidatus Methanoperedens sp.]
MKSNKSTKILIILSIIGLIAFAGCTGKQDTITTPDGDVKISEGGSGPDWCKTGTKMTTTGADGKQGYFEIKGSTNYEGKEVCESQWSSDDGSVTQYFNEDSSYLVIITKDKSGKEINKVVNSQPK